ncbi:MAG: hypothetical protein ACE5R6_02665 [Candidatus Heimdallarchaeota archaeon]
MSKDKVAIRTEDIYDLIMLLSSLSELKRRILLALAHLAPKAVSGVQLTKLINYSGKSRTLYRGVLDELVADSLILADKLTPRLYSVRINHEHPLIQTLIQLVKKHGCELRALYGKMLHEKE